MTKEQAYEKLELPAGIDLQIVRQKFQQMHNDFQVQIDGAFNEAMRKRKEQQLEELKEAFALLNESDSMDDSASLPHTQKTFLSREEDIWNPATPELPKEEKASSQPQPQAAEPTASSPGYTPGRAFREPKWWHITITIPMIIACAVFIAELLTGEGRSRGYIGQAFFWVMGTIIGSSIILNHYTPLLVPPYLRGSSFNGARGRLTLVLMLLVAGITVYVLYITGANNEKVGGIHWKHYIDIGTYILIFFQFIWILFMGLMLFIGLINPSAFYFKERNTLFITFMFLLLYQIALVTCLGITVPSAQKLTRLSDSSYLEEQNQYDAEELWEQDLDSIY